jgi:hypothetical protein
MTQNNRIVFDYNHGSPMHQPVVLPDSGFDEESFHSISLLTAPPASLTPPSSLFSESIISLPDSLVANVDENSVIRNNETTDNDSSVRFFDHSAEFLRLTTEQSAQHLVSPRPTPEFLPPNSSTPNSNFGSPYISLVNL